MLSDVSPEEIIKIADSETDDSECKSIQTVLTHVIGSGYGYAVIIRKYLDEKSDYKDEVLLNTVEEYLDELQHMFQFNVRLFADYPTIQLEEYDN